MSTQHTTQRETVIGPIGSTVCATFLAAVETTISRPDDAAELSAELSAHRVSIDRTVLPTQFRSIDTTHFAAYASAFC